MDAHVWLRAIGPLPAAFQPTNLGAVNAHRHDRPEPLAGLPDTAENHHTVSINLSQKGSGTRVDLTQDHNPTDEAREESENNWTTMLTAMKALVER